ncbi:hypothetical protein [Methylobacterium nigriterrae]|uniref:hypothetical protein n=1 Tax=Methylobacterium nigriterrae TaxID=3127512 RepID=UPI003013F342
MLARLSLALAVATLASAPTQADDCPKHFRDYGLFLQAKKSCARDEPYPSMKVMKGCAKETPKESALNLMDEGRREWARRVMRTSLGSMCQEVFSEHSAAPKGSRRSVAKEP